jgi:hypothetical protein
LITEFVTACVVATDGAQASAATSPAKKVPRTTRAADVPLLLEDPALALAQVGEDSLNLLLMRLEGLLAVGAGPSTWTNE